MREWDKAAAVAEQARERVSCDSGCHLGEMQEATPFDPPKRNKSIFGSQQVLVLFGELVVFSSAMTVSRDTMLQVW